MQQLIAYRTSDASDDGILAQSSSSNADSLPTGADAIITPNEDAVHVITKANFGYQDSDGDAFTSVKISSLPAAGTLKLDGTAVQQNVPISVTDIDANKLTFEAAPNASGDNYASIGFVVMNAKGEDSTPNTLTVNVQPVADAATGVISLTGTVQEGATLTITEDTALADADGAITKAYQWLKGSTNDPAGAAPISGAMHHLIH